MRSFVVTMLFAAVIAEDGYTCTDSNSDWISGDLSTDVTTSDECKTACDTAIEDSGTATDNDWCCHATAVADPVSMACDLYSITAGELDIRAEEEVVDGTTNSAWAWGAGVALDDLTVVEDDVVEEDDEEDAEEDEEEEDDEDMSVRMTASALAAASFAMLAM